MHNTQYKTVGVQWFASICFSNQLFQRWIRTRSENPTVSYCQPLGAMPFMGTAYRYPCGVLFGQIEPNFFRQKLQFDIDRP